MFLLLRVQFYYRVLDLTVTVLKNIKIYQIKKSLKMQANASSPNPVT